MPDDFDKDTICKTNKDGCYMFGAERPAGDYGCNTACRMLQEAEARENPDSELGRARRAAWPANELVCVAGNPQPSGKMDYLGRLDRLRLVKGMGLNLPAHTIHDEIVVDSILPEDITDIELRIAAMFQRPGARVAGDKAARNLMEKLGLDPKTQTITGRIRSEPRVRRIWEHKDNDDE